MDCQHNGEHSFFYDAAKKIIMTLVGVLLVYVIFFVGVLIRNAMVSYYYIGQADQQPHTITVEGQAEVDVVPDVASVRLGIQVIEPTQQEAQDATAKVMNALIEGLKERGIADEDIKTDVYVINPWFTFTDEGREQDGYQATQNVTVTIRDTQMTDDILAFAGEQGANQIGGLQFEIDDPAVYQDKARVEAIQDAYEKAKELQLALGVRFVRIVSYNEYAGGGYPQPFYARSFGLEEAVADFALPKVEPGTDTVTMNVSITFELR